MSVQKSIKVVLLYSIAIVTGGLLSFTKPGGEGFEIYVDNKLVMQRYNKDINTVQALSLDNATATSEIKVKYWHCGKIGKNRSITLKDGQDKVLKQWRFADVADVSAPMTFPVKDLLVAKKTTAVIKIVYSSSEIPGGRQLATIKAAGTKTAALID